MAAQNTLMDNPHEEEQLRLLSRIVNNMKSLNESVHEVNMTIHDINDQNKKLEVVSLMWQQYTKSTEFNIEATGQTRDPI